MMNELAGGPVKKSTPATLVDLRAEFAERRHAVQSAGFDEAQAAAMLASLAREEERAIREWQMR